MAFTPNNRNANTDRPVTQLGEVIEQIHDHRMTGTPEGEFRFCPSGVRINPAVRNPRIARLGEVS